MNYLKIHYTDKTNKLLPIHDKNEFYHIFDSLEEYGMITLKEKDKNIIHLLHIDLIEGMEYVEKKSDNKGN